MAQQLEHVNGQPCWLGTDPTPGTLAAPTPEGRTMTIEDHLRDMRRANRAPSTIYQRERVLARLQRHTGVHPLDATEEHVEDFLSRPLAPESQACELTHLRQWFVWAQRRGHRLDDPTADIERPTLPRRLPRPIADVDLALALEQAPDRIRPWLHLAAYAGLRAGEVAQLRADAVHPEAAPPVIIIERSKGGGMSSVTMHPHLIDVLAGCGLPRSGYLFRRCDGRPGPNAAHTISHMSNAYLRSLGLSDTFHSLRHWFGTNVYRSSGRDLRVAQESLRHRSPVSTAIYTFVDPGEQHNAVAGLPVLGPLGDAA